LFIEADQEDEQFCYIIAIYYSHSIGIELNFKKMKFYAKKSLRYRENVYLLGIYYYAFKFKYLKSFTLFIKDAQSDFLHSKRYLAFSYYYGYGTSKDIEKAQELIQELSISWNKLQIYLFSKDLFNGFYSFEKNITLSNEFLRTSRNLAMSFADFM
jgi:TPR repeat protein